MFKDLRTSNSTDVKRNYEEMREIWNELSERDKKFLLNLRSVDRNNNRDCNSFRPNIGFPEEYALRRFPCSSINYSFLTSCNFVSRMDRRDIAKDFVNTWGFRIDKNCNFTPSYVASEYNNDWKKALEDNDKFKEVYDEEKAIINCTKDGSIRVIATEECLDFIDRYFEEE